MVFDYLAKRFAAQKWAAVVGIILAWFVGSAFQPKQVGQNVLRSVAVTFDDLPATHGDYAGMKAVTDKLLASLKANRVPAIGFVTEYRLAGDAETARRTALLRQWLDDGHDLGNHSYSHVAIDRVTFGDYAADVIRGEPITRALLKEKGKALRYYRHTQLRTGPTEEYRKRLADFLTGRGYTVAPVTVDNNDYVYALAYLRAKQRSDSRLQARIADDYIRYMESVFEHFERLSREFLGYEIRQTLLLHANEINGDHFDKLARMLRRRGYRFITLDEALRDEAYRLPEAQSKRGLSWLHRWMLAKGLAINAEPLQPDWIDRLARQS